MGMRCASRSRTREIGTRADEGESHGGFRTYWRYLFLILSLARCTDEVPRDSEAILEVLEAAESEWTTIRAGRSFSDLSFGSLSRVRLIGDRLVVADASGDPWIHILNANNGSIVRSVGRTGEGPGEFKGVRTILVRPQATEFAWVFDMERQRLTEIDLRDSLPSARDWYRDVIQVTSETGVVVRDPEWISDDRILAGAWLAEAAVVEIDLEGRIIGSPLGPPLPDAAEEVSVSDRMNAYQPFVAFSGTDGLMARTYLHAGRIDIFATANGDFTRADVPMPFDPYFSPSPLGTDTKKLEFKHRAPNREGYHRIHGRSGMIFALFSGVPSDLTDMKPGLPGGTLGRSLHVFSWAGDRLGVFKLDIPDVTDFEVDWETRRLWTLVDNPEPTVMLYLLPDLE